MRALRPCMSTCLFLLFILLTTFTAPVRADDEKDIDEYDEAARVARISLIRGDVQLKRNGSKEWESARMNFPLVEGDLLATTGSDARLELQIDARNFVRVGGDSMLRMVSLRDEGVALSLSEGVATIRLARFDRKKEYFEIDVPRATLAAETRGLYRIDVSANSNVRMTVRGGAQARIYSETSGFTLRDGRTAELIRDGSEAGDWAFSKLESFDSWDTWVDERERSLASRSRYDDRTRYYDSDVWGAEDLDAYGSWVYVNDYGWIWRPNATVVNNYSNWAPYRYGRWVWCPPYGWTWVGDEPWGWAPYHYGRWVYYDNGWCWAPRGYGYSYGRSWWRPALVVFVYVPTSYGERVCWYPLTYGQRDPRGRHYRRLEPLRGNDIARLGRTNPAYLRAITSLPARDFGRHNAQSQQAPAEIARRALNGEPIRGRLPIQPLESPGTPNGAVTNREPRSRPARGPALTGVVATLQERPTGAATRMPGVALDGELRRTRLYNGREPRESTGSAENGGMPTNTNGPSTEPTGVVARPPRARGVDRPSIERGAGGNNGSSGTPWYERPVRPPRETPGANPNPVPQPSADQPEGVTAPTPPQPERPRAPRREGNDGETGTRPPRRSEPRPEPQRQPETETVPQPRSEPRPEPRVERPEPRPEPRVERPEPRPEPRYERPEPRPESRPEPPPREERQPEPRAEPRPEPRPEPTPQREEPRHEEPKPEPKAEPSQREEPKHERSEDAPARPSRRGENR
ncbi:MAG: hypothetical protein QOJ64_2657 [Acidobacteriota bacterium]|nr:hypothetical protein [Acidobacteriota bacterium]